MELTMKTLAAVALTLALAAHVGAAPLYDSAYKDDVVVALLNAGANPNAKDDIHGTTPLYQAAAANAALGADIKKEGFGLY